MHKLSGFYSNFKRIGPLRRIKDLQSITRSVIIYLFFAGDTCFLPIQTTLAGFCANARGASDRGRRCFFGKICIKGKTAFCKCHVQTLCLHMAFAGKKKEQSYFAAAKGRQPNASKEGEQSLAFCREFAANPAGKQRASIFFRKGYCQGLVSHSVLVSFQIILIAVLTSSGVL